MNSTRLKDDASSTFVLADCNPPPFYQQKKPQQYISMHYWSLLNNGYRSSLQRHINYISKTSFLVDYFIKGLIDFLDVDHFYFGQHVVFRTKI